MKKGSHNDTNLDLSPIAKGTDRKKDFFAAEDDLTKLVRKFFLILT